MSTPTAPTPKPDTLVFHDGKIQTLYGKLSWKNRSDDPVQFNDPGVSVFSSDRTKTALLVTWDSVLASVRWALPRSRAFSSALRAMLEPDDIDAQRMARFWRAVGPHVVGGATFDQAGEELAKSKEQWKQIATDTLKESSEATKALRAVVAELDLLMAPDTSTNHLGEVRLSPVERLNALLTHWQDEIRDLLPGHPDGAGSDGGPLDLTLAEVEMGLENAREEGREQGREESRLRLYDLAAEIVDALAQPPHEEVLASWRESKRLVDDHAYEGDSPRVETLLDLLLLERHELLQARAAQEAQDPLAAFRLLLQLREVSGDPRASVAYSVAIAAWVCGAGEVFTESYDRDRGQWFAVRDCLAQWLFSTGRVAEAGELRRQPHPLAADTTDSTRSS